MTPQEKAKELVNNMFNCDNSTPEESMAMLLIHAKQCALIAVDEILKNNPHSTPTIYGVPPHSTMNYWQEVKQEIELL